MTIHNHNLRKFARILVLLCLPAVVFAVTSPTDVIKKGTDNVLSVLNNSTLDPAQRRIALRKEIHLAVKTRFEFQAISKSVMSTNWKKAKGYEQDRFVDYFTQTLENTYFTAIDSYSGEEIEYLGETIKGERAVVDTAIVSETKRIPVSYRMKLTDGEWYIYDVVIENVSLVSNYRNLYATIIKSSCVSGLLNKLELDLKSTK